MLSVEQDVLQVVNVVFPDSVVVVVKVVLPVSHSVVHIVCDVVIYSVVVDDNVLHSVVVVLP